jgi:hypothetical protein
MIAFETTGVLGLSAVTLLSLFTGIGYLILPKKLNELMKQVRC